MAVWQELNSKDPLNANEFQQEIIWNNRFIRINGKAIYYKTWVNKGILRISDLIDTDDHFLSFENFKYKIGVRCTFLDYAGVLAAIPKAWKSEIVGNIAKGDGEPLKTFCNGHAISSTKKGRLMLAEKSFSPPIVEINLKKQVPNVKAVYELPFKVFQFKLIHNIIPTNLSLYKMSIKDSPRCDRCLFQNETLVHRFCECPDVKIF